MAKFNRVEMVSNQKEIARVNRKTGVLFLNSVIWNQLPGNEKEFVLLHEKGHLQLQTKSEFRANRYAVKNFAPVKTFNNRQLGKRIMVMRNILSKADEDYTEGFTDALVAGAVSGLFQTLPLLGIGSKSRQAEAAAKAEANVKVLQAQSDLNEQKTASNTKVILISGVLVLVIVVTFLLTRKK